MAKHRLVSVVIVLTLVLSACGSGGGGSSSSASVSHSNSFVSTTHSVTVSWAANDEVGVNSAGGGYQVLVDGKLMATVPYVSGSSAPTSTTITLSTGNYSVTVRAFAALDPQGGSSGSFSAPSQAMVVSVP